MFLDELAPELRQCSFCLGQSNPQSQKASKQTSSNQWRKQQKRWRGQEKREADRKRGSVRGRLRQCKQHAQERSKGHKQEEENGGDVTRFASSQSGESSVCEESEDCARQ